MDYNIVLRAGDRNEVSIPRIWANFQYDRKAAAIEVLAEFRAAFAGALQKVAGEMSLSEDDHAANFLELLYSQSGHEMLEEALLSEGITIMGEVRTGPVVEITGFDRYLLGEMHRTDIKSYRIEVPTVSTHRFAHLS